MSSTTNLSAVCWHHRRPGSSTLFEEVVIGVNGGMDTSLHSLAVSAHRLGDGRMTLTNRIALLVAALVLGLTGIVLVSRREPPVRARER